MRQFEYAAVELPMAKGVFRYKVDLKALERTLNAWGREGWELAVLTPYQWGGYGMPTGMGAVLKRERDS